MDSVIRIFAERGDLAHLALAAWAVTACRMVMAVASRNRPRINRNRLSPAHRPIAKAATYPASAASIMLRISRDQAAPMKTPSIRKASAPVIIADRAIRSEAGMALLVELAELLSAAVIDAGGRMNFPWRHPLNQSSRK
eukprot:gene43122-53524_t